MAMQSLQRHPRGPFSNSWRMSDCYSWSSDMEMQAVCERQTRDGARTHADSRTMQMGYRSRTTQT